MVYYRIQSNVTIDNQDAYLSVGANNKVIIEKYSNDGGPQIWSLAGLVDDGNNFRGVAIVNKSNGLIISAPQDRSVVTMIPFLADTISRATWNIAGSAIQLRDNNSMNLNILGGSPYQVGREVGVWTWDGGGSNNELWTWQIAYDQ